MRRRWLAFLVVLLLMAGCTLAQNNGPTIVVTATLPPASLLPTASPAAAQPVQDVPLPLASATPVDLPTATVPMSTPTAPPPTPIPPTPTGPPTVLPLDDGSGHVIVGTGNEGGSLGALSQIPTLPETLYYLAPVDGLPQVWRLRYGLGQPEVLTYSASGILAYDVAADGTLAYIEPGGTLIIEGVPFALPETTGPPPSVTAISWSPGGDWLAYTLWSPDAEPGAPGPHAVDGIWIRNRQGNTFRLASNTYSSGVDRRVYGPPVAWRPDGSEILVRVELHEASAFARVNILDSRVSPVWNETNLPPDAFSTARWSINNNAIITSGRNRVLRIEPDTLAAQVLVSEDAGLWTFDAQQFANGAVMFVGQSGQDGFPRLYGLSADQSSLSSLTDALTGLERLEYLWDDVGQQTLLVAYQPRTASFGTCYVRDSGGALRDLSPVIGQVGAARWGPMFQHGDAARTRTTRGDTLNVRAAPGGEVLFQLSDGVRVTILDGPRRVEGYRWWRIRTSDGISGWSVDSVVGPDGFPLRTLVPAP